MHFTSPEATQAIIPHLLRKTWNDDNPGGKVLWEIGQQGVVSGDVFVKVAYEPPYQSPIGQMMPGRIRILPINPAHAFCEFHPHDRTRFLRFKLKYKYWGTGPDGTRQVNTYCVDDQTEALTRDGWKAHDQLSEDDEVLAVDPDTGRITWEPVLAVNRFPWSGDLVRWQGNKIDALTTPNHRWMLRDHRDRDPRYRDTASFSGGFKESHEVRTDGSGSMQLVVNGGDPVDAFAHTPVFSDEFVELLAWVFTEGSYPARGRSVLVSQSESHNPEYVERLRVLAKHYRDQGATCSEMQATNAIQFYFGKGIGSLIRQALPDKQLTPEVLGSFTYAQARLFYETAMDGDGHRKPHPSGGHGEYFAQKDQGRVDSFQMLCSMLGRSSRSRPHHLGGTQEITVYNKGRALSANTIKETSEHYEGVVWCPSVRTKTWLARRNGVTYWTGNTEILTDEMVEEYVNDEMIDSRPNPLGRIPIVHCTNKPVASSPWGTSDIADIIGLNREFNEKATEVSDIINYHSAPVTVITGAKANNLEKGPRKVWTIGTKDARVQNLTLDTNMAGPLGYMELLKSAMHEFTGVPVSALGQLQPISNTSGTALHMQFFPAMQHDMQRKVQYTDLLQRVNELIILTAAIYEPEQLVYNPQVAAVPLKPTQYAECLADDPATYKTTVNWPSPLPMDVIIKLNEEQAKMSMGLQSKRGAIESMGETFPDQKLREIFEELLEDQKEQGALGLVNAQTSQFILQATGAMADGTPVVVPGVGGQDENGDPVGVAPAVDPYLSGQIMERAYGEMPPARSDFDE